MKLILEISFLCLISSIEGFNRSEQQVHYRYEGMHRYGAGKRIIPDFRAVARAYHEHPQPLPVSSTQDPKALVPQPYPSLYQGRRTREDMRVYRKSFKFPATTSGHRVVCDHLLNCTITFIAVESQKSIPIILRGGVGYRHFTVVVKARPNAPLEGSVRAYCQPPKEDTL